MFLDDYDRFDDVRQLSSVLRRLDGSFHADADPPISDITSAEALVTAGLRLRRLRERSRWSAEEISERTGVPLAKLSEFEAGSPQATSTITRGELARLTSACCGTLADVLGSEHPRTKPSLPSFTLSRGGAINPHG